MLSNRTFIPGSWVIYRSTKFSPKPGPRAKNVAPAPNGDEYHYTVDKFWVVREVRDDGSLVLQTRRGKQHVKSVDLPNLHRANLFQRWWYRERFLKVEQGISKINAASSSGVQEMSPGA